jgi:TPR repeat protein
LRATTDGKRWAEAAATQGSASAQCRLGQIHHNAWGVARDAARAVHWFQLAAAQGDAEAQMMLGAAFHLGLGVAQHQAQAFRWLTMAAGHGNELAAGFLRRVEAVITAEERAAAQSLLRSDGPP